VKTPTQLAKGGCNMATAELLESKKPKTQKEKKVPALNTRALKKL
jgi:hypothetical protein